MFLVDYVGVTVIVRNDGRSCRCSIPVMIKYWQIMMLDDSYSSTMIMVITMIMLVRVGVMVERMPMMMMVSTRSTTT